MHSPKDVWRSGQRGAELTGRVLSESQNAHLEQVLYERALAAAGESDSPRNRLIAASDYWLFLSSGGGTDAEAVVALARGLRACDVG